MSFNGAQLFEAEVLTSNPATHTVRVRLATALDSTDSVDCSILSYHGNGDGDAHHISMPSIGQTVMVIVDSSLNGVVLGTLQKSRMASEPSSIEQALDPLSSKLREVNHRGEDYSDIMPGDVSLRNKTTRLHITEDAIDITSGNAVMSVSEHLGGFSHLHTAADTLTHKNSLLALRVSNTGASDSPALELAAATQTREGWGRLDDVDLDSYAVDTKIAMNSATPFSIDYDGMAGVSIDSQGNLMVRGKTVTIDTDGQVHQFGQQATLNATYTTDISLATKKSLALNSEGKFTLTSSSASIQGSNAISMVSADGNIGITAGGSSKGIPVPGLDQTMELSAPRGAIRLTAGSSIPGPSSVTKPGIRLQSSGGGDIHLVSQPSLGGAFTTGTIVLDSAVPVSSAVSGGLGGYGVVLNSPNILIGGFPGLADTPAGFPGPFGPPVPPVYDSFVKHFSMSTVYNPILLASVVAGLTAAFPPLAPLSVPLFSGPFATAMATMAIPPIGRPLAINFLG